MTRHAQQTDPIAPYAFWKPQIIPGDERGHYTPIRDRFRIVFGAVGVTQDELASSSGIAQSQISRFLGGTNVSTATVNHLFDHALKIARVPVWMLVQIADDAPPVPLDMAAMRPSIRETFIQAYECADRPTLTAIGFASRVSRTTISGWLCGRNPRSPRVEDLDKVLRALAKGYDARSPAV